MINDASHQAACNRASSRFGVLHRKLHLLIGAGVVAIVASAAPAVADPLAGLRWKSRVLVVVAQNPNDEELRRQRQYIEQASSGMFDRNVVVMEAVGDSQRARDLRSRLSTQANDFRVFLVGKDGHTAFASDEPLAAKDIFGRIDAMPMRKDEMRKSEAGRSGN